MIDFVPAPRFGLAWRSRALNFLWLSRNSVPKMP